jgi:hypothetical protein
MNIEVITESLRQLLEKKQEAYGNSVDKTPSILEVLFPDGVRPHQYRDMLLVVRILDKIGRIANRPEGVIDRMGESPYMDIAGYGVLGVRSDIDKGSVPSEKDPTSEVITSVGINWENMEDAADPLEIGHHYDVPIENEIERFVVSRIEPGFVGGIVKSTGDYKRFSRLWFACNASLRSDGK